MIYLVERRPFFSAVSKPPLTTLLPAAPTQPVYFLSYLRSKDQTEYSGVETYVAEMLERQDLSFVPSRTSLVIQNRKIGIGDEGDMEDHIGEMIDLAVGSITKTISSLTASITEVTARLDDPESQPKVVR